nr:unnamed protein product [Digitaria exilis]
MSRRPSLELVSRRASKPSREWKAGPEPAPRAGEDAGARSLAGGADTGEHGEEQILMEIADAVFLHDAAAASVWAPRGRAVPVPTLASGRWRPSRAEATTTSPLLHGLGKGRGSG